uniref:Uncharacterized protein n=1 Tax=Chenopodium quinoa TaxID=63459 RepID=A0A803LUP4_CHEQI
MVVDWVPSMKGIQLKYIPTFILTTDKDDIMLNFLKFTTERAAKSSAPIIFNSFDALEHDVLEDILKIVVGPIYNIGPMQLQLNNVSDDAAVKSLGSNLWKEDSTCFEWLDSKKPKSVVYVSFGSITTMTNENLIEFAWGLANKQQTNCWFSFEKWGIGMEIDNDVRRSEVERQVRELMEDKRGEEMASKALEWKKLAEEALATPSGSSYLDFEKLVNQEVLSLKKVK